MREGNRHRARITVFKVFFLWNFAIVFAFWTALRI